MAKALAGRQQSLPDCQRVDRLAQGGVATPAALPKLDDWL